MSTATTETCKRCESEGPLSDLDGQSYCESCMGREKCQACGQPGTSHRDLNGAIFCPACMGWEDIEPAAEMIAIRSVIIEEEMTTARKERTEKLHKRKKLEEAKERKEERFKEERPARLGSLARFGVNDRVQMGDATGTVSQLDRKSGMLRVTIEGKLEDIDPRKAEQIAVPEMQLDLLDEGACYENMVALIETGEKVEGGSVDDKLLDLVTAMIEAGWARDNAMRLKSWAASAAFRKVW